MIRICENMGKGFLTLFFIFLPFQLRSILVHPVWYENGNFNPYQTIFIYINDIFLVLALTAWGFSLMKNKQKHIRFGPKSVILIGLLFLILIEIQFLFKTSRTELLLSAFFRYFEWCALYFMLINEILPIKRILQIFILTIAFQATVGIFQSFFQSSVHLQFLGEPILAPELTGIAKIDLLNTKIIRSYGTLSHPNVLGGLLVFGIFATIFSKFPRRYLFPLIIIQGSALLLTFSRSAILALIISPLTLFFFLKPQIHWRKFTIHILTIIASIVIAIGILNIHAFETFRARITMNSDAPEVHERWQLVKSSMKMIKNNPILGVGTRNFTNKLQEFNDKKLTPWEYQPVHNIFLLISSEQGIVGLFLFIIALIIFLQNIRIENKMFSKKEHKDFVHLLFLLATSYGIIMMLDHYPVTIYQGQILLTFLIAFYSILREKEKKRIQRLT